MQTSSEVHIKLQINDFADEAEKSAMENGRHEEQGHLTGRLFFGQLAEGKGGKALKEKKFPRLLGACFLKAIVCVEWCKPRMSTYSSGALFLPLIAASIC